MASFVLPLAADGQIAPHDHPDLQGARRMIRGVVRLRHVVRDDNRNCWRLSSALFRNSVRRHGYLSFDSEFCMQSRNEDPASCLTGTDWDGAVAISVQDFRSFDPNDADDDKWKIGMVPLEEEVPPKPCHGAVWGDISEGKANGIRRATEWFVPLPDVVIDETALPLAGQNG